MHRITIAFLFLLFAVTATALAETPAAPAAAPQSAIDRNGMDPSVKPSEDFYKFANGKWEENTPIPEDRPLVANFTLVQDRNRAILHQILEETANDTRAAKDSIQAKVGAFYRSGMDEAKIEAAGAAPLHDELERIAAIRDGKD